MVKVWAWIGSISLAVGLTACGGGAGGGASGDAGGSSGSTTYGNGMASGGGVSVSITKIAVNCARVGTQAEIVGEAQGSPVLGLTGSGATSPLVDFTLTIANPGSGVTADNTSDSGTIVFSYSTGGQQKSYAGMSWSLDLKSYTADSGTTGAAQCAADGSLTATLTDGTPGDAAGALNVTF
jgi:hypothetical protein